MNKATGNILVLLVGGILLLYTASRSIHVVQATLPPDSQIVGYAALAGLDGAMLAWAIFKMYTARGEAQHAICTLMLIIQLAGIALLTVGDTVLTADPQGAPLMLGLIVLYTTPIIISANMAATVAVHLSNPEQVVANARRALDDEIERQVAEQLKANQAQIAAAIAPEVAKKRAIEVLANYTGTASDDLQIPGFQAVDTSQKRRGPGLTELLAKYLPSYSDHGAQPEAAASANANGHKPGANGNGSQPGKA